MAHIVNPSVQHHHLYLTFCCFEFHVALLHHFLTLCVQVLSSHLMHSSLPGLTRLEQMFLVALADTVATTSAEVPSSTDQQYTGPYICL